MRSWSISLILAATGALVAAGLIIGIQEAMTRPPSAPAPLSTGPPGGLSSELPAQRCAPATAALAAEGLVPAPGFTLRCGGSPIMPTDQSILSTGQQMLGWTCFAGCGPAPVISISPAAVTAGGTTLAATLAHEFCHSWARPAATDSPARVEEAAEICAASFGHGRETIGGSS